jgi:hypothetical protein
LAPEIGASLGSATRPAREPVSVCAKQIALVRRINRDWLATLIMADLK